jgi:hypothetical protein
MKRSTATLLLLTLAATFSLSCKQPVDANSNSSGAQSNVGAQQTQSNTSSQPTPATVDKDNLLKILVSVEKEFDAAARRGDRATMERLMADDFKARYGGQLYDKDSWIGNPKGYPNIETDEILRPELIGFTDETATIHYDERIAYNDNTPPGTTTISTTFVKKNGSWQIKSIMHGH